MPVLVGFRAFRPASSFVSWDTDASPQSGTFHTRDRQPVQKLFIIVNNHDSSKASKKAGFINLSL